MVARVTRYLI